MITKNLEFPIHKEFRRYNMLNDFFPFQKRTQKTLKIIDDFTGRLLLTEQMVIPEIRNELKRDKGIQGKTSGTTRRNIQTKSQNLHFPAKKTPGNIAVRVS